MRHSHPLYPSCEVAFQDKNDFTKNACQIKQEHWLSQNQLLHLTKIFDGRQLNMIC
jgi:hypothetical protein